MPALGFHHLHECKGADVRTQRRTKKENVVATRKVFIGERLASEVLKLPVTSYLHELSAFNFEPAVKTKHVSNFTLLQAFGLFNAVLL